METKVETGELVIERVFNAPRELVWKAWTDPAMIKQWWGPREYSCPIAEVDFRVGGTSFNCMRGPDGADIYSIGTYQEIVPLERIVVTDSFADKDGNVVPSTHYGMPEMPLEMLITVTFEDAGAGKTKMTLRHKGLPEGDMMGGANEGWGQSFDKLAELLAG